MTTPHAHHEQFYDFQGSAYDIGVQHGKMLAKSIVTECERGLGAAVAASGMDQAGFLLWFLDRYEPMFREHVPRAIDEIRGLAAGSGLDYAYAFYAATRDGIKRPTAEGCTAFHAGPETTADGHALLGQTKDTAAPIERYHIMRRTYEDGLALLTLNYAGWIANIGLNSHGVACTGNSLYASPTEVETVPFSLMRYLMAEASSADGFLAQLEGLALENGCFMIADAAGRAYCLENAAGRRHVFDISGQAFGHANTILSAELKPFEDKTCETPSSPYRQRNVQARLDAARGKLDAESARAVLSDHAEQPFSVCLHPTEKDAIFTTAAMICDCTAGFVDIALGRPCESPFVRYPVVVSATPTSA